MSFRLLVIEDNPGDADLIAELVDEGGGRFEVTHVTLLGEGLNLLSRQSFDVVLTDLGLPDAERNDVLRQVKARAGEIAVVVMTGLDDEDAAVRAMAEGAQDYLVKGQVDARLLDHSLRHSIERNRILADTARLAREAEVARSDAEAARWAARTANEAKDHFLSRMSHELRTPLNAVLGFGQLLELELADTEHGEAVEQILRGGRHLLDLINDVLDIARIDVGETSISCELVPISGLVQEAMQPMAPLAGAGGVTMIAPVRWTECTVIADRQRLRQIMLNLLSNAVKYNRPGGKVWVERRVSEDDVAITVHDDGPGIRLELQSRLFTPFDRLGAESSGVEGTGIGLSLTRSLAELMRGSVTVDSLPGRGSEFTVTLPRAHDCDEPRIVYLGKDKRRDASADPKAGTSSILLYIEDNEPNVRLVEQLLRLRPGWELIHTAFGDHGIELARSRQPDLILLDLHLPNSAGIDVLKALKGDAATSALPVVIITADATTGQARGLLDAGAAHQMTKPLDINALLALFDEASAARDHLGLTH